MHLNQFIFSAFARMPPTPLHTKVMRFASNINERISGVLKLPSSASKDFPKHKKT